MSHFYSCSLPCFWCTFFVFYNFIEDLSHHLFRFFVARFDVFGSDSIAVCLCCLCFESAALPVVISGISFISLVSVPRSSMLFSVSIFVVFRLSIIILIVVVQLAVEFSKDFGNSFSWCTRPRRLFLFSNLVMSILLFADFMPGIFLIPSNSSSILWICSCLFVLLLSLMHFLNLFAQIFQSLFLTFGSVFFFFLQ